MKAMKSKSKRTTPFFDPMRVSTELARAIQRDLDVPHMRTGLSPVANCMFANRQIKEFLKKFSLPGHDQERLEQLTYQKFLDVNTHMGKVRRSFTKPPQTTLRGGAQLSWEHRMLIRARAIFRSVVGYLTEDEWFLSCKNSSGASLKVPFWDTSPERKLTFPITVSSKAKTILDRYFEYDNELYSAVVEYNRSHPLDEMYQIEESSRASTVDKNNDIRRMIAIEATGNMFLQQGLMEILYDRCAKFGLDLSALPTMHKYRAYLASVTGSDATIDWSSASDCVLKELVEWLAPLCWFEALNRCRHDTMLIAGETVDLNMFSTMGNATTFPIETLVFWSLAQAAVLTDKKPTTVHLFPQWEDLSAVSVFGDDCILPCQHVDSFIRICQHVGFLVNEEKSFFDPEPGFRESCGGDYYRGVDVRPFHLRAPTSNTKQGLESWLYIVLNGILTKYIQCFGPLRYIYDKEVLRYVMVLFERYKLRLKVVPDYFPDDAGLKVTQDLERFMLCYKPKYVSPIGVDIHGSYVFRYNRFIYREKERRDDHIRYATWLKKPKRISERRLEYPKRRRGRYVSSVASSCFMTLRIHLPHHWVLRDYVRRVG